jgi:hypothetical protein
MWEMDGRGCRCAQGVKGERAKVLLDLSTPRLLDSAKTRTRPRGRARAGRGRGFSEGGGIGDPGSLSAPIYVARRTVDSWTRVMGDYSLRSW